MEAAFVLFWDVLSFCVVFAEWQPCNVLMALLEIVCNLVSHHVNYSTWDQMHVLRTRMV